MEVVWKVVLTVVLLCWRSEGQISCKNEAGVAVDWYILYKKPDGFDFIYIDSSTTSGFTKSTIKGINHQEGVLAQTLKPILTDTPTCGFVAYSDQPPCGSASSTRGHSKGVVMVDDAVVWLLHSTPNFPESRESNKFFPDSGKVNAQTFICVTFPVGELKNIEDHLKNIRAHIFDFANIDKFSLDVEKFQTSKADINKKTQLYQDLKSKNNKEFKCFFSKISAEEKVGDLYVTIAEALNSDLFAQTWGGQRDRSPSYCPNMGHKVYNVKFVKSDSLDVKWGPTKDHSKWCVSEGDDWTCIGDSNRAKSQSNRPGGALCIKNANVKNAFTQLINEHEECPTAGGKRTNDPGTGGSAPTKKKNT